MLALDCSAALHLNPHTFSAGKQSIPVCKQVCGISRQCVGALDSVWGLQTVCGASQQCPGCIEFNPRLHTASKYVLHDVTRRMGVLPRRCTSSTGSGGPNRRLLYEASPGVPSLWRRLEPRGQSRSSHAAHKPTQSSRTWRGCRRIRHHT
jgi:hypothetical protein